MLSFGKSFSVNANNPPPSLLKKDWYKYRGFLLLLVSVLCLSIALPVAKGYFQSAQDTYSSPYLRNDPDKITLSDRDDRVPCGECHTLEYDVWKGTPHSTGFDEMHRSPQAQSILERMDFGLSKRESLCLQCHYTANIQREQARAIAGVSCESCHGAARDWIDIHNNYQGATHETESAQAKQARLASSDAGGMLRPSDNIYGVAANCFECHTVPEEELINVGRHPSGSSFELVEWSGNIQHNFLQAQWSSDESNREPTDQRKRQMYVVGRILDYEYSIRGAARATEDGSFVKAMQRRVVGAYRELEKVARTTDIPQVTAILQLHQQVEVKPNNEDALLQIAENIRSEGQTFGEQASSIDLAAIDLLIAGGSPPSLPAETAAIGPATEVQQIADAGPVLETEAAPADAAAPPQPTVSVQGERRSRPSWFRTEQYEVTVPGCNCHATAEDWLFGDPHGNSANIVLSESQKAVEIATLYGLSRSQMKAGNQICMQCHGTIESGTGPGEVYESVGCESCHGPSSGYLQPHKRGQGYQNGLRDLNVAAERADNCAQCHLITDERLLASGHSSGANYNIVSGSNSIKHWPDPDLDRPPKPELDGGALRSAFESIKSQRPVPSVQVASLPAAAIPPAATPSPQPEEEALHQPRRALRPPASPRALLGHDLSDPLPGRLQPPRSTFPLSPR